MDMGINIDQIRAMDSEIKNCISLAGLEEFRT